MVKGATLGVAREGVVLREVLVVPTWVWGEAGMGATMGVAREWVV